jgi:hypothetical protein
MPQEKTGFKPVIQQSSPNVLDNPSRPTPIHLQNNQYPASEGLQFVSLN